MTTDGQFERGDRVKYTGSSLVQIRWGGSDDPRDLLDIMTLQERIAALSDDDFLRLFALMADDMIMALDKIEAARTPPEPDLAAWEPEVGQEYAVVGRNGETASTVWHRDGVDKTGRAFGNCHPNEATAEAHAKFTRLANRSLQIARVLWDDLHEHHALQIMNCATTDGLANHAYPDQTQTKLEQAVAQLTSEGVI